MRLCDALTQKEMDVRLRDRHLAEGKIKSADVETYLNSLTDDESNLVETNPFTHAQAINSEE